MALGDTNIIGDVTQTLQDLLTDLDVTLESPAALPTGGEADFKKLNLFLYQVTGERVRQEPAVAVPSTGGPGISAARRQLALHAYPLRQGHDQRAPGAEPCHAHPPRQCDPSGPSSWAAFPFDRGRAAGDRAVPDDARGADAHLERAAEPRTGCPFATRSGSRCSVPISAATSRE